MQLVAPLPDVTTAVGTDPTEFDLGSRFEANDVAGALAFSAGVQPADAAVSVGVFGETLVVSAERAGAATVRVVARGAGGGLAADSFAVVVDCVPGADAGEADFFPLAVGTMGEFVHIRWTWRRDGSWTVRDTFRVEVTAVTCGASSRRASAVKRSRSGATQSITFTEYADGVTTPWTEDRFPRYHPAAADSVQIGHLGCSSLDGAVLVREQGFSVLHHTVSCASAGETVQVHRLHSAPARAGR